jgi:hypothetical protein
MKREKLGSNEFVWVRKCKGAKVCVDLPYYGGIIGACSIKVRPHYDGESCANGNKCTSGICDGTKCKGLNPNIQCKPGLGQCKKGYLCRATEDTKDKNEEEKIFRCQKALSQGTDCSGYSVVDSSDENQYLYDKSSYFDPANNPCKLGYICSTAGNDPAKCIAIGNQKKDVEVSNPMACESGLFEQQLDTNGEPTNVYKCIDPESTTTSIQGLTLTTSRGATFTNFANITKMFKDWLKEIKDNSNLDDEDAIYEAYRYSRNKKKINKLFFQYSQAGFLEDADECAFDYLWKQSSSSSLKFSLMILVLALLF